MFSPDIRDEWGVRLLAHFVRWFIIVVDDAGLHPIHYFPIIHFVEDVGQG